MSKHAAIGRLCQRAIYVAEREREREGENAEMHAPLRVV